MNTTPNPLSPFKMFLPQKKRISKRSKSLLEIPTYEIVIFNIPSKFVLDDVLSLFPELNDVSSCKLISMGSSFDFKQKALIKFKTIIQAKLAIEKINNLIIDENKLCCEFSNSNDLETRVSKTLLIRNISNKITIDIINHLFLRFGDIIKFHPIKKEVNSMFWKCEITFSNFEDAFAAFNSMNNYEIESGTKPISIQFINDDNFNRQQTCPSILLQSQQLSPPK